MFALWPTTNLPVLGTQDLLVMDRGYPSRDLFAQGVRQGVKFCARLSSNWSVTKRVLRAGLADQIHEMGTSDASLPLRILRHALPNGTVLKAHLQVENWSGVLPHTVEQDFYAALVRANCAAALALEADPKHACLYLPEPDRKGWRRALNCTLVIKSLRHALSRLLLNIDLENLLAQLLARLRRPGSRELTRADRPATRPRHDRVRLAGFHFAYKSA